MVDETEQKQFGPKKRLTRSQAIAVMVGGAALLILPWFIPSGQGSSLYAAKMALSTVGFIMLCVGSYFRP